MLAPNPLDGMIAWPVCARVDSVNEIEVVNLGMGEIGHPAFIGVTRVGNDLTLSGLAEDSVKRTTVTAPDLHK